MEQNTIIIKPDFHCEVYINNVFQTIAQGRESLRIRGLSAGKYSLKCICTICNITIENELNIPDDSKVEISFEDYVLQHPECIKYQLDFAVFMEEIKIRLILPESLINLLYTCSLIIFVFAKSFNQYSVSAVSFNAMCIFETKSALL